MPRMWSSLLLGRAAAARLPELAVAGAMAQGLQGLAAQTLAANSPAPDA
jgi:hypothetical protein